MGRWLSFAVLLLMALTGCRKASGPQGGGTGGVEGRDFALVEVKSGRLAVSDLANEAVEYQIPGFTPGLYRIPVGAIRNAPDDATDAIFVDTGVLFFVDADAYPALASAGERLWEETNDSFQLIPRREEVSREIGIRYGYIESPGLGSGFDFEGDGAYVLDLSQVKPAGKP